MPEMTEYYWAVVHTDKDGDIDVFLANSEGQANAMVNEIQCAPLALWSKSVGNSQIVRAPVLSKNFGKTRTPELPCAPSPEDMSAYLESDLG